MHKTVEKRLHKHRSGSIGGTGRVSSLGSSSQQPARRLVSWLTTYRWSILMCTLLVLFGVLLITRYTSAVHTQQNAEKRYEASQKASKAYAHARAKAEEIAAKKAKVAKAKAAAFAKAKAEAARQSDTKVAASADCAAPNSNSNPASATVIVNKKHCMQPLDYTPALAYVDGGYPMSTLAAPQYNAMVAASGLPIHATSVFRPYSGQVITYNYWVQQNGSTAAADTVSARPGYSEHQTGLAADLACDGAALAAFDGTTCYQWLVAHAAEYGFIQRYQSGYTNITGYAPEPWHWRYVGASVALDMKARGIHTLEQYYGISGGDYYS